MRAHHLRSTPARFAAGVAFIAAVAASTLTAGGARAASDDAAAETAARAWSRAVMDFDVDGQLKLAPKRLFATAEQRERERKLRLHEKEMAVINNEKYLAFDLKPAIAAEQVGATRVVVFPYRSVKQVRDGKMQRDSSLIAIADGGSNDWTILDGSAASMRSLKALIPGYAGSPRVPQPFTRLIKD
jgi:hypothetical protein